MGMAWPQLSKITATQPYFTTLIDNHAVASGKFGVKLASTDSFLYLGGTDPAYSNSDFTTVKLTRQAHWQLPLDSANVNGRPVVSSLASIIDTGATLVVGDIPTVAEFYKSIKGAQEANSTVGPGYYTFPCNSSPQVSLTFGGTDYNI